MKSKFISLSLALVLVATSALAAGKLVSYTEFKKVALNAVAGTESDEECQLRVKENNGGLVLFMRNANKTASFFVSKDAEIRRSGTSISDGYSYDYKVAGEGILSVTHMDDAYFHVTLESLRNNQITHCDIDF